MMTSCCTLANSPTSAFLGDVFGDIGDVGCFGSTKKEIESLSSTDSTYGITSLGSSDSNPEKELTNVTCTLGEVGERMSDYDYEATLGVVLKSRQYVGGVIRQEGLQTAGLLCMLIESNSPFWRAAITWYMSYYQQQQQQQQQEQEKEQLAAPDSSVLNKLFEINVGGEKLIASPLALAAACGSTDILSYFLSQSFDGTVDVNLDSSVVIGLDAAAIGTSALNAAVKSQQYECCKLLLDDKRISVGCLRDTLVNLNRSVKLGGGYTDQESEVILLLTRRIAELSETIDITSSTPGMSMSTNSSSQALSSLALPREAQEVIVEMPKGGHDEFASGSSLPPSLNLSLEDRSTQAVVRFEKEVDTSFFDTTTPTVPSPPLLLGELFGEKDETQSFATPPTSDPRYAYRPLLDADMQEDLFARTENQYHYQQQQYQQQQQRPDSARSNSSRSSSVSESSTTSGSTVFTLSGSTKGGGFGSHSFHGGWYRRSSTDTGH